MAIVQYASMLLAGGISGESFDIAQGPADTGIIDVLLSVGDGVLTEDAPLVLVSTGALGGARILDLKGSESESAAKGSMALKGRMFYLSVQNSDIATNNITIKTTTVGGTINGAADLVVSTAGDYMLHHVAAGVWRVNLLPRPAEAHASIARVTFSAADWDAGATKNSITILQTGAPAAGQVGPHSVKISGSYVVDVINTDMTPDEKVEVETQFDAATGNITLKKAPKAADFAGVAVIIGSI